MRPNEAAHTAQADLTIDKERLMIGSPVAPRERSATQGGADQERALRAALGLADDASSDHVAVTQAALADFLDGAPPELAGWVDRQRPLAEGTPPAPATWASSAQGSPNPAGRRTVQPAWVLLAIVAVVLGVYFMGDRTPTAASTTPGSSSSAPTGEASAPPLDEAKVTALKAKLEKSPNDIALIRDLADTYFAANYFTNATVWQKKLVDLQPKNVDARLVLGAAYYNSGDMANAEAAWKRVIAIEPKNAEAYYDLGFLHMAQNKSDLAQQEWDKVVELAPNSELAKNVQAHAQRLSSVSPSASTSGGTPTSASSGSSASSAAAR